MNKSFSFQITLKNFHLSPDYGLILMWNVNMTDDEFACNSLFVYHETELDELLMRNSPIKVSPTIFELFSIFLDTFSSISDSMRE